MRENETNKVLIFGGTTEGRVLARRLIQAGVSCKVCVATEYGEQVLEPSALLEVHQGRLDVGKMRALLREDSYVAVVDATHPFATVVTENIRESLQGLEMPLPYFRLMRDVHMDKNRGMDIKQQEVMRFSSTTECVEALQRTTGTILLTTGSKELSLFCREESLRERLVVRVLPGKESIDLCYENGLMGKQIIAMQGPFSKEMNLAMFHQYQIDLLVTKESGRTGGADTKFEAAMEAGIPCYLIEKPKQKDDFLEMSMQEVCQALENLLEVSLQKSCHLEIVLAGIGMGTEDYQTLALRKQLAQTDLLFGASRMIGGLTGKIGTYPYYLAKDILPVLMDEREKQAGKDTLQVTILYSGDSGFFSGTEKMVQELSGLEDTRVRVLPGISSLSYFAAAKKTSWQDARIISAHGTKKEVWKSKLWESVLQEKKTFLITSGLMDIKEIGTLLEMIQETGAKIRLSLGYQLSYENEKIWQLEPRECEKLSEEGLYVAWIENEKPVGRLVVPTLADETFCRGKVPMTKEEIRHISLCKLGLRDDSVVYDIGSGTGSIAMEMAVLSAGIRVYAIETNPDAIELMKTNREKLHLENVEILEGMAPEALQELPAAGHAFIGGSKGRLKDILACLFEKNPDMTVVINAVSLETLQEIQGIEQVYPEKDVELIQMAVTRTKKLGSYHMPQTENPIWICRIRSKIKGTTL